MAKIHNRFKWPPDATVSFYDRWMRCFEQSDDPLFDLADNLMDPWPQKSRTVTIGIRTDSTKWIVWDEANVRWVEWLIGYDLTFDGAYHVKIERLTEVGMPGDFEFLWKLKIKEL